MRIKSLYKSEADRTALLKVYEKHQKMIPGETQDVYVDTSFGRTHLIKAGNPQGKPLFVFSGADVTAAFQLVNMQYMLRDNCCYGVDIIGHPGKSEDAILDKKDYAYGRWMREVMDALKIPKANFLGSCNGCGVITNLMCAFPQSVERAILYVPASLYLGKVKNLLLFYFYNKIFQLTQDMKWKAKVEALMIVGQPLSDAVQTESAAASGLHMRKQAGPCCPSRLEDIQKCHAQVLVLAGEEDHMFELEPMTQAAKAQFGDRVTVHTMKGRGHIGDIDPQTQQMMIKFLQ